MNLLRGILTEIVSLFVDDWLFAVLLIVWVGLFAVPVIRTHLPVAGLLFFVGVAGLTIAFVLRQARALQK